MARYIDVEDFRQKLIDRQITTQFFNPRERHEIGCIIEMLDNTNSAEVVSKNVVASLQSQVDRVVKHYEERDKELHTRLIANANAEVAGKIFEKIENIIAKEIHKCEILRDGEKYLTERKYWEGGEHSLRQLIYWLTELKEKYTEAK